MSEAIKVRGTYRICIADDNTVVSDSGWVRNALTNIGFSDYICKLIGKISGSKQITHVALGTGSTPGLTDTALSGEVSKRAAVSASLSSDSRVLVLLATFYSSNSFVTASKVLQNIGLFESSSGGYVFSGGTYATTTVLTNQNVYITYTITFV